MVFIGRGNFFWRNGMNKSPLVNKRAFSFLINKSQVMCFWTISGHILVLPLLHPKFRSPDISKFRHSGISPLRNYDLLDHKNCIRFRNPEFKSGMFWNSEHPPRRYHPGPDLRETTEILVYMAREQGWNLGCFSSGNLQITTFPPTLQ